MASSFKTITVIMVAIVLNGVAARPILAQSPPELATLKVLGWAATATPSKISIYNLDGKKVAVQDFTRLNVAGPHHWDQDFDLIEIAPGQWVQKQLLRTQLCETPTVQVAGLAGPGAAHHDRAGGAGSGSACGG